MQAPILRRYPYPYRAALSITSDIDDTETLEQYERIRSLMNEEIGIKFTNTFFPFHDGNKFSFFSGKTVDKNTIIDDIRKGLIDAIHSFGEKNDFTRQDALLTLKTLKEENCKLQVWIDHAESKSNLCKYRFFGKGDMPGEDEYHFDLIRSYGVKFIWTERLTNIIGQGVPLKWRNILEIYDRRHPLDSVKNIAKTVAKIGLDIVGYEKYNYFKHNKLINIPTMRDGQKIYEFIRFNNHPKGAAVGDTFEDLAYFISNKVLCALKKSGGYCIVYVHLGKKFNLNNISSRETIAALHNLKREIDCGNIYVDCVSKLLTYYLRTTFLEWSFEAVKGQYHIHISSINDPVFGPYVPEVKELQNVTFYTSGDVKILVNGAEIKKIQRNAADHTGRESVTII
jgi:hypothetical protein